MSEVEEDWPACGTVGDAGTFRCSTACLNACSHIGGQPIDRMDWTVVSPHDVAEKLRLAFAEDAKRLAELREELATVKFPELELVDVKVAAVARAQIRRLVTLIAVYEECQARGRLFGGLR